MTMRSLPACYLVSFWHIIRVSLAFGRSRANEKKVNVLVSFFVNSDLGWHRLLMSDVQLQRLQWIRAVGQCLA